MPEYIENYYAFYFAIVGSHQDKNVTVAKALSVSNLQKLVDEDGNKFGRGADKRVRATKKRFYVTPEQITQINALYNSGLNMDEVGKYLGIAKTTVNAHIENSRGRGNWQTAEYMELRKGMELDGTSKDNG